VVGRDAELLRIAGLARDAAAGRGRLVLIEGEPGIGKTLLLRAALNDAAGLFPRRLTGAAEELDQRWPFATIRACLEPLVAGDQRVTDMLASVRGGVAEYPTARHCWR
jgi:predicted ATPase